MTTNIPARRSIPPKARGSPSVIGDKNVLFMANHGISTVGATVADAYDMLYYVERAAQVQIYAMWTGQKLKQLPGARGRKDPARLQGRASLRGTEPGPAALRCAEAHARPQGAGLRDVVCFFLLPLWEKVDADAKRSRRMRGSVSVERVPSSVAAASRQRSPSPTRERSGSLSQPPLTSSANRCQISGRQLPLAAPEVDGNIHTLVSPISSNCSP